MHKWFKKIYFRTYYFLLILVSILVKLEKSFHKLFLLKLRFSQTPAVKRTKYLQNAMVGFSKNLYLETTSPKQPNNHHLKNEPFFAGLTPYLTGLICEYFLIKITFDIKIVFTLKNKMASNVKSLF